MVLAILSYDFSHIGGTSEAGHQTVYDVTAIPGQRSLDHISHSASSPQIPSLNIGWTLNPGYAVGHLTRCNLDPRVLPHSAEVTETANSEDVCITPPINMTF